MPPDDACCRRCRHFEADPERIEALLPGLTILSSAYGSTRGDSGICLVRERLQDPGDSCDAFVPREDP